MPYHSSSTFTTLSTIPYLPITILTTTGKRFPSHILIYKHPFDTSHHSRYYTTSSPLLPSTSPPLRNSPPQPSPHQSDVIHNIVQYINTPPITPYRLSLPASPLKSQHLSLCPFTQEYLSPSTPFFSTPAPSAHGPRV